MAHPAEQTLANDGVMLTEGRRTAPDAPAYLGTNLHCLRPNRPCRSRGCHQLVPGGDVPTPPACPSVPRGWQGKAGRRGYSHGTRNGRTRAVPMAARKAGLRISPQLLERQDSGVPMAPGMAGLRVSPWLLEKQDLVCPHGSWDGRTWRVPLALGKAGPGVSPWHLEWQESGYPNSQKGRTWRVPIALGKAGAGVSPWHGEVAEGLCRAIPAAHRPSHVPQTPLLCWRLPGAWRIGCSSSSASSPSRRL